MNKIYIGTKTIGFRSWFCNIQKNLEVFLLKKDQFVAICQPLSSLVYKQQRVIILLVLIWSTSLFISLPEAFILIALPYLNDRTIFPCVVEDILLDLTACVPFWSNTSGFIYTSIKAAFLYVFPLIVMVIFYRKIIKTLWITRIRGKNEKVVVEYNLISIAVQDDELKTKQMHKMCETEILLPNSSLYSGCQTITRWTSWIY